MNVTLKKTSEQIRTERQQVKNECGAIKVACLWPKKGENLGTLGRTCDAVGACMVVPVDAQATKAIRKGNTIGDKCCVHRVAGPVGWLAEERYHGTRIIGVELASGATQLKHLPPLHLGRAIVVLGHEAHGIPKDAWHLLDEVVEIPMRGVGNSLNVAVAGSLILYKLAGLS